jgi:hypothetical protein
MDNLLRYLEYIIVASEGEVRFLAFLLNLLPRLVDSRLSMLRTSRLSSTDLTLTLRALFMLLCYAVRRCPLRARARL